MKNVAKYGKAFLVLIVIANIVVLHYRVALLGKSNDDKMEQLRIIEVLQYKVNLLKEKIVKLETELNNWKGD